MLLAEQKAHYAVKIVTKILEDLTDRKGLGNEWDDYDDEIQEEIRSNWENIIYDILSKDAPCL